MLNGILSGMTSSGLACCAPAAPEKPRQAVKIAARSVSVMVVPPECPGRNIALLSAARQGRTEAARGALRNHRSDLVFLKAPWRRSEQVKSCLVRELLS